MDILQFKDVYLISNEKNILKDINISIEESDFITITGPSGSGKSTFLRLCNNLISPTHGEILFKGVDIFSYEPVELRRKISLCFQMPYLFGNTVYDNLAFPFNIRKLNIDTELMAETLEKLNLSKDFLHKDISNLSGGEKQRVALARTIIFKPNILLLDEITSALDEENTIIVENILKQLNYEGITIMLITHNTNQWNNLGNRKINMQNGILKESL